MVKGLLVLQHYPTYQGPAKKARPIKAGSHNLHYHINKLNTKKSQASGDVQSKHATRESYTNWDGIHPCMLLTSFPGIVTAPVIQS